MRGMVMNSAKWLKMKAPGLVVLILLLAGLISCTDDFTSMNTPDDELTTDNIDFNQVGNALAQAQYSGMMTWYQVSHNLYAAAWSQYTTLLHPIFPYVNMVYVGAWMVATLIRILSNMYEGAADYQLHHVTAT